jgi:hypothetical protein
MRKRTVQSVLARRHMFKNGGMVPPQAQPAGILASSPSLVDAVSNDALSDMGGGTLSMAQGGAAVNMQPSYVFNQGGIAKFANGGAYYDSPAIRMQSRPDQQLLKAAGVAPDALTVDRMPAGIKVGGSQFIPVETTVSEIINESPIQKYNRIFNPDIDPDSIKNPLPPEKTSRFDKLMFGISNKLKSAGSTIGDAYDYAMEPGGSNKNFDQISAINTMVRRRPDLASVIEDFSSRLIQQNPKISPRELSVIVAGALSEQQEGVGGYDPNSVESQAGMGAVGDGGAEEYLFNKYAQPYREQSEELAAEDEFERFRKGYLGEGLVDQEGGVAQGLPIEDPGPESVVPGTESVKEETDMKGILPPKIKPPAPEKPVDPSAVSKEASKTIQQVKSAAELGDSEEVKKGIEEYAAEFKAAMPEYEGKSQYESGMDFVKMGMAIAAGQSPNAIENISKGVLGTIDNFTSDEKEKRLYKRQVNLSAAKYGLQSVRSDDVFAKKIIQEIGKEERAIKQFIVSKPFTENGVKYEKGNLYQTTVGDMKSDDFSKTLPNLTTTGIWGKMIDKKADLLATLNKRKFPQMIGSGKGAPNAQSVNDQLTKYGDEIKNLRNSAMMMTMLDKSIITNAQGKVTGFSSFASRTLNKLASSANMKGELKILDTISSKRGKDSREFQYQQQVIANMMLKEILGEGSKNVSNIDRDLAQQIVGLMNEWDSIFADKELLHSRMQNIRSQVNSGIENGFDRLSNTEFVLQNTVNRADEFATDRLTSMRSRLGSVKKFTNPERKGAVKFSDYFDFETNKLKRKLPR